MVIDKYSIDGKKNGQIELSDSVFNTEVNDVLVYEYVRAANANLRQGTHKTKGFAEVNGGGVKPWRQKGTGRARQGSIRAPQWRGGGTVFGPVPRSYRIDLPKKLKDAAFRSLLTIKAKEGSIKVIDDFKVESGKTKDMNKILKTVELVKGLLVGSTNDEKFKRSIRNIEDVKYNDASRISGRDVFYSKKLVLTESAVKYINEKYAKGNK
ncbi:MAG TPA: 50S ribosomal protein L4 [Spirochaetota bacterium]|nr:50S ribosomal protein L4 [Spirochaetota bacterium]